MGRPIKTAADLTQQERMLADAVSRNREYLDTAYAQINPNSQAKDFHKQALSWWNTPAVKEYTRRNPKPRRWTRHTAEPLNVEEQEEDKDPILFIYTFEGTDFLEFMKVPWTINSPFASEWLHNRCYNMNNVIVRQSDLTEEELQEPTIVDEFGSDGEMTKVERDKFKFDLSLTDWIDDPYERYLRNVERWKRSIAERIKNERGYNTQKEVIEAILIDF